MHIIRPAHRGVGGEIGIGVVVARGDENAGLHPAEYLRQHTGSLIVDAVAVEKVAGDEYHIYAALFRQRGDLVQQTPLFLPPGLRFFSAQPPEGRVQMQVAGM